MPPSWCWRRPPTATSSARRQPQPPRRRRVLPRPRAGDGWRCRVHRRPVAEPRRRPRHPMWASDADFAGEAGRRARHDGLDERLPSGSARDVAEAAELWRTACPPRSARPAVDVRPSAAAGAGSTRPSTTPSRPSRHPHAAVPPRRRPLAADAADAHSTTTRSWSPASTRRPTPRRADQVGTRPRASDRSAGGQTTPFA
jgi:hypothetical protein